MAALSQFGDDLGSGASPQASLKHSITKCLQAGSRSGSLQSTCWHLSRSVSLCQHAMWVNAAWVQMLMLEVGTDEL